MHCQAHQSEAATIGLTQRMPLTAGAVHHWLAPAAAVATGRKSKPRSQALTLSHHVHARGHLKAWMLASGNRSWRWIPSTFHRCSGGTTALARLLAPLLILLGIRRQRQSGVALVWLLGMQIILTRRQSISCTGSVLAILASYRLRGCLVKPRAPRCVALFVQKCAATASENARILCCGLVQSIQEHPLLPAGASERIGMLSCCW